MIVTVFESLNRVFELLKFLAQVFGASGRGLAVGRGSAWLVAPLLL